MEKWNARTDPYLSRFATCDDMNDVTATKGCNTIFNLCSSFEKQIDITATLHDNAIAEANPNLRFRNGSSSRSE
jgi:hypothetical protein